MLVKIRPETRQDIEPCGRILFEAFKDVFERHHFPPPFSSTEKACQSLEFYFRHPSWCGLVAEVDGQVVGSCFVDERDLIRGIGPVSIDPRFQKSGVGRRLMEAMLERCSGAAGMRLTQDAFNTASISLYTSLGFKVREPIVGLKGRLKGRALKKIKVLPLRREGLQACDALCHKVHGIPRTNELRDAVRESTALAAVRDGRITAYASSVSRQGHGVAETDEDLQAVLLFAQARYKRPISLLVPARQADFLRWCLNQGLRVVDPLTLMTVGRYQEPEGCFFISVRY
ncbi:MAG: GNAT family N-acetyltransferase [Deltaproteobacteria bacterium]|nr:GNAT family N-acetyltransferase [Deltaproteobacteria bacterium]MBW2084882.1 GNAT family N-acetyltransferase [Deltaproteobacteria bacterium]